MGACTQARIELYRNVILRSILAHGVFLELHLIYAKLKPRGLGQAIWEANPDLPKYFRKCMSPFYKRGFATTSANHPLPTGGENTLGGCSEHKDHECATIQPALRLQLACGILDADEIETVASSNHGVGLFTLASSHLCHSKP